MTFETFEDLKELKNNHALLLNKCIEIGREEHKITYTKEEQEQYEQSKKYYENIDKYIDNNDVSNIGLTLENIKNYFPECIINYILSKSIKKNKTNIFKYILMLNTKEINTVLKHNSLYLMKLSIKYKNYEIFHLLEKHFNDMLNDDTSTTYFTHINYLLYQATYYNDINVFNYILNKYDVDILDEIKNKLINYLLTDENYFNNISFDLYKKFYLHDRCEDLKYNNENFKKTIDKKDNQK